MYRERDVVVARGWDLCEIETDDNFGEETARLFRRTT
jgi:hypothetical protein